MVYFLKLIKQKCNVKAIYAILFHLAYLLCIFLLLRGYKADNYRNWLEISNYAILTTLILQLITSKFLKISFVSISSIFLIAVYIFHFSQNYLLLIGYNFKDLSYSIAGNRFGLSYYIQAVNFCLYAVIAVFIGMMCENIKKSSTDLIKQTKKESTLFLRLLGVTIFCISFPAEIYIFITRAILMYKNGYLAAHNIQFNLILTTLSTMFPSSVYLMIMSYKEKKKYARLFLIIFIIYQITTMYTGMRAYAIVNILVFLVLYFQSIEKINIKKLILIGILAFLLLNLTIYIRNNRAEGMSLLGMMQGIFSFKSGSIINNSLSEFGITIDVVTNAFKSVKHYAYGKSILTSLLTIIPGWTRIFGTQLQKNYYTMYALNQIAWGSSFISDLYFDFGYLGIVACGVYGFFVMTLSKKLKRNSQQNLFSQNAILLYITVEVIFSVRRVAQ